MVKLKPTTLSTTQDTLKSSFSFSYQIDNNCYRTFWSMDLHQLCPLIIQAIVFMC